MEGYQKPGFSFSKKWKEKGRMNLVLLVRTKDPGSYFTDAEAEAQYLEGEPEQPERYVLHANLGAKYVVTGDLMQCLQDSSL